MSEFTKAGVGHEKYQRLIKAAQALPTIQVAVVHPCDDVSLQGVIEATRLRLIEPILVGRKRPSAMSLRAPVWISPASRS